MDERYGDRVIRRWQRYGQDRLYVKDDDGNDVGWWDLLTDRPHPVDASKQEVLSAAMRRWRETSEMLNPAGQWPVDARTASSQLAPVFTQADGHEFPPPHWAPPQSPTTAPAISDEKRCPVPNAPVVPPVLPFGPPPLRDLAMNGPAEQLSRQIELAHEAGQRPTFVRRVFLGKHAYSTWERGAIGEQMISAELTALSAMNRRWHHLNSIPVGSNGADIDHLVVGPGGVFTINTKHHHGANLWVGGDTVMVNGTRVPYVRNSRHEARRANRLLSKAAGFPVAVRGLVVPVGLTALTVKQQPRDVQVVNWRRLTGFLMYQPPFRLFGPECGVSVTRRSAW